MLILTNSFTPSKFGIIEDPREELYYLVRDYKVTHLFIFANYFQGLPFQWQIKSVVHTHHHSSLTVVFEGKIDTDEFAKLLFNRLNIKYEYNK